MIGFVALLLILGGIGAFAAYKVNQRSGPDAPENATSDFGFTLTAKDLGSKKKAVAGAPVVQLYDDFFCAECRRFSKAVSPYLRQAVRRGEIKLTYHPFPIESDSSTNHFAERAANAAACVGDAAGTKAYAAMHDLLLENQPKSGKAGAGTAKLIAWAVEAGAKEKDVEDCIQDRTFLPWIEDAVLEGERDEVTKAPTIKVDGRAIVSPGKNGGEVMPDKKELEFAIKAANKG